VSHSANAVPTAALPPPGREAAFFVIVTGMEQKFIRWLEENFADVACAGGTGNVLLGIGDDGAVLAESEGRRVLVADAIVDQVHCDSSVHDLKRIGHKALAVNLSDIAAMGAVAESALVSLVIPRSFTFEQTTELFTGIATTAKKHGVIIVGGDTCTHEGPLMISITCTGRVAPKSKVPNGWRMDGAKPNDLLVVTGGLGGSILGNHLDFEPRLDLARSIQQQVLVNAVTDISDSLLIDLAHMMRKSGVGAMLDTEAIPVTASANELAKKSGRSPVEHAMQDGEDFELLLSLPNESFELLRNDPGIGHSLFVIGGVVAEHPGKIIDLNTDKPIEPAGYEHKCE